jgi:hypothetical protein
MRRERVADLGTQRQRIVAPRYPKVTPMDPIRRPVHPRIQRRRDLAASVHIPPELGAKFTEGEIAVVKIISGEIVKHGSCTLTIDAIADLAGINRSVVKVALRTAKAEGLIEVEQGRVDQTPSPFRSRSAAGKGAARTDATARAH